MNENECRIIYREAFCDPTTDFEDLLFKYCSEHIETIEEKERTVAMLFALPIDICCDQKLSDGYYIYSVATKKDFRRKGYMTRLMGEVIKKGKPMILKPADDYLIKYYQKLGFSEFRTSENQSSPIFALPKDGFKDLISIQEEEMPQNTVMMCCNTQLNLNDLFFPFICE